MPHGKEPMTGTRMAKRGIWYFMRTVLILVAVVGLCYGVFQMAMHASNLYILATEGLKLRAECILQDGNKVEMGEYFTQTFLDQDQELKKDRYADYNISSYDYEISLEGISVWPWSKTASVTIVERVSINGSIRDEAKPQDGEADAEYPLPEWKPARYIVRFIKYEGRWYIYQMQLKEIAPSQAPLPTYDPSLTPLPAVTPTPKPTATPVV